ncbi:MAG: hypothetical protein K0S61_3447 [Anaerocolumna sp.]|nr:hypothetical protein [Anaerocolumna sp.]
MKEFYEVLDRAKEIALATSVYNIPNVRIVNFVYDTEKPGILYFTSNRNNPKVKEFNQNNNISITTIPTNEIPHVRSHHATVKKSERSLEEIKNLFIQKVPGYDETIEVLGTVLDVFEIQIHEALVVTGFANPIIISF